jgi:hypothetical protein
MRTSRKQLEKHNDFLQQELSKYKVRFDYNSTKIEDDFNVLNQILDLKLSHYQNIIFVYNRYQETKKVNVKTEEIDKATSDIVKEAFLALSEKYTNYLVDKYFSSKDTMVDTYAQQVYLKLFAFANNYNMVTTKDNYKKSA